MIVGFRNKDIVILEDEFKAACDHLYLMTDDGSYGEQGFVTVKLQQLLESGRQYDEVLAIGPIPMMKFVSKTTEPFGVKTIVSASTPSWSTAPACAAAAASRSAARSSSPAWTARTSTAIRWTLHELMNRNTVYREREAEVRESHKCRMQQLAEELIK